jgi:hypothetical protein
LERLLLVALGVAGLFLVSMLASTEGHAVPQVVDLYLVCQYARAFAEGHPFHYYVGDPASSGATSLLYTALLALGQAAGARGEGLVAVAIGMGLLLYLGAVALAYRAALRVREGDTRTALLAAALVALGGPAVWGFLYGSDVALFMLLTLWLLVGLLDGVAEGNPRAWVVPASLLSLARPEGLVVGIALAAFWCLGPRRGKGWALVPLATALAVLLLYRVSTGHVVGSSVAEKSLLLSYSLRDTVGLVSDYLMGVLRGVLLGLYPPETPLGFAKGWAPFYLPPLALVFVLSAAASAQGEKAAALRAFLLTLGSVVVVTSPNIYMGVHFNRYLMFALPSLLVLVACGLGDLAERVSTEPGRRGAAFKLGAGVFLACGLLSTLRFAAVYGELSGEVYRRDVAAASWISRAMADGRLPPGFLAADVATSVEYLTGHRNLNLHGVTSPQFFGNRPSEREAGVFEALGRLPEGSRPSILITSHAAQDSYPSLRALVDGPALFTTTSGTADDIEIYRMTLDALGKSGSLYTRAAREAVEGLERVDSLNVCDSVDERAHAYHFRSQLGDLALNGSVRRDTYRAEGDPVVMDAGRAILGEETFRVRTPRPGHDLLLVQRTAPSASATIFRISGPTTLDIGFQEEGLQVFVDGRPWQTIHAHPTPGWDEQVLRIPGTLVRGSETELRLAGRYSAFYYWFYQ